MSYPICGKCLHSIECHTLHTNKHYMYCGVCNTTCSIEQFNKKHKPTSYIRVMETSAKKQ